MARITNQLHTSQVLYNSPCFSQFLYITQFTLSAGKISGTGRLASQAGRSWFSKLRRNGPLPLLLAMIYQIDLLKRFLKLITPRASWPFLKFNSLRCRSSWSRSTVDPRFQARLYPRSPPLLEIERGHLFQISKAQYFWIYFNCYCTYSSRGDLGLLKCSWCGWTIYQSRQARFARTSFRRPGVDLFLNQVAQPL